MFFSFFFFSRERERGREGGERDNKGVVGEVRKGKGAAIYEGEGEVR